MLRVRVLQRKRLPSARLLTRPGTQFEVSIGGTVCNINNGYRNIIARESTGCAALPPELTQRQRASRTCTRRGATPLPRGGRAGSSASRCAPRLCPPVR